MKLSTLLHAYEICQLRMEWHEKCRERGSYGIAVNKDEDAIKWQRYDRAAKQIRRGIVRRLERIEGVKP